MPVRARRSDAGRKKRDRQARYDARQEEPRYPGVLFSPLQDCPHGTDYGYREFGCRCIDRGPLVPNPADPDGDPIPSGCRRVGVMASAQRRSDKKFREAPTVPMTAVGFTFTDSALSSIDTQQILVFHRAP